MFATCRVRSRTDIDVSQTQAIHLDTCRCWRTLSSFCGPHFPASTATTVEQLSGAEAAKQQCEHRVGQPGMCVKAESRSAMVPGIQTRFAQWCTYSTRTSCPSFFSFCRHSLMESMSPSPRSKSLRSLHDGAAEAACSVSELNSLRVAAQRRAGYHPIPHTNVSGRCAHSGFCVSQ